MEDLFEMVHNEFINSELFEQFMFEQSQHQY
jgi:hypothetical protein